MDVAAIAATWASTGSTPCSLWRLISGERGALNTPSNNMPDKVWANLT